MIQCPDKLTIQAVIDGEETDIKIIDHLQSCPRCCQIHSEMKDAFTPADNLGSTVKLPAEFLGRLNEKLSPQPFPAAMAAAVIFTLAIFSAYLTNPGYLQWWLSVGITRQISYLIDAFIDLLYISHIVGPTGVIIGLAALVALEVLILNMLRNVEGQINV